jgi:hypothetical protein
MAVLAMVLSGAVLIFCAVVFAQRLTGAPERKRGCGDCAGGGTDAWVPATAGGDGADCSGADGGGGCDGGGGGD